MRLTLDQSSVGSNPTASANFLFGETMKKVIGWYALGIVSILGISLLCLPFLVVFLVFGKTVFAYLIFIISILILLPVLGSSVDLFL
jgi:type IV secretory pathway VirB6-like protein